MKKPTRIGRPPIYPFGEMVVGDTRLIPGRAERVRPAAGMFARERGWKFKTQAEGPSTLVERVR